MSPLFPILSPIEDAEAGSDVAYTPDAVARAIVARIAPIGPWAEPCAGGGAFVRAMSGAGWAMEIDPGAASVREGLATVGDALTEDYAGVKVVITNPPFSCAARLLRRLLAAPDMELVALLLLQGWIVPAGKNGEERADLCWGPTARPVGQVVLYPRISFGGPGRKKGTDQREYAVLVWRRQPDGGWCAPFTRLDRLVWRDQ